MGPQHRMLLKECDRHINKKREAHSSLASRFQGVLEIAHCSRNEQLRTPRRYEYMAPMYAPTTYGEDTPWACTYKGCFYKHTLRASSLLCL